jgi:hypothetical protein
MTWHPDVNYRKFEFHAGPYRGQYFHITGPAGVCLPSVWPENAALIINISATQIMTTGNHENVN